MQVILPDTKGPHVIKVEPPMDDELYYKFCERNPDLEIERTSDGKLEIMPPAGIESSFRNSSITRQLSSWALKNKQGREFESSAGFILPNGAARSPDAAWVSHSRLEKLSDDQKRRFPRLSPNFVIELRSPSDRLPRLRAKMREWVENGVELAWLIDVDRRAVSIYRPDQEPEELLSPDVVVGEGPVKGFRLKMSDIWAGL